MNARLAVYKGAKLDQAIPLTESSTTIGRDDGNSVLLADPEVSKRHAVIHAKAGTWTIEDLHSTNGIKVNEERATRAELKNGDRIRIGPFDLVFESDASGDWVPTIAMDLSSKVGLRTIAQGPANPPSGFGGRHP